MSQPQLSMTTNTSSDKTQDHMSTSDVTFAPSASTTVSDATTDVSEKTLDLDQVTSSLPDVRTTVPADDVTAQQIPAQASRQVSEADVTQSVVVDPSDELIGPASPSKGGRVTAVLADESLTPKQETSRQASCEPGDVTSQLHKSESLYAESLSGVTSTESTLSRPKPNQTMNFENLKHKLDQLRTTIASRPPDNPAHAGALIDSTVPGFNTDVNYHTLSFMPSGVSEELQAMQQQPRSGSVPNLEHAFSTDSSLPPPLNVTSAGTHAPQPRYGMPTQPLLNQDPSNMQALNSQLMSLLQPYNLMTSPSAFQSSQLQSQLQSLLLQSMGVMYPQFPLASQGNLQTATILQMVQLQQSLEQQNSMLRGALIQLLQQYQILAQAAAAAGVYVPGTSFTQSVAPQQSAPSFLPSTTAVTASAFNAPDPQPLPPPAPASMSSSANFAVVTTAAAQTAVTSAFQAPIATSAEQASSAVEMVNQPQHSSMPPDQPLPVTSSVTQQPPTPTPDQAVMAAAGASDEQAAIRTSPKAESVPSKLGEDGNVLEDEAPQQPPVSVEQQQTKTQSHPTYAQALTGAPLEGEAALPAASTDQTKMSEAQVCFSYYFH